MAEALSPGLRIRMGSGVASARFSLGLTDALGHALGLTSRFFLDSSSDPKVYDLESGHQLGERLHTVSEGAGGEHALPFYEAIGVFRLIGDPDLRSGLTGVVSEPDELVGAKISFDLGAGVSIPGRVLGYGGGLKMASSPNGGVSTFRQPLIVQIDSEHDTLLSGGSGALLVDGARRAGGVLIARDGHRLYVAPLAPFIEKHGLALPARKPAVSKVPSFSVGDVAQEAEALRRTMTELRNELAAQPSHHQDPEGRHIPERLKELTESA